MEKVYDGRLIKVYTKEVHLPNGVVKKYEMINHPGAVAILAFDKEDIILVRQNRPAVDKAMLEIPAGKLEVGEDPLDAAKREFSEETGYEAKSMRYLGAMLPSVGYTNEAIHLYLASDLSKGDMHLDEDEFLNVVYMNKNEFHQMVMNNEIEDAKTLVAYLKYLAL